MKYDVLFSDGHTEVVEAIGRTIAEVTAVGQHPGYSRVVDVRPHVEMVDLDSVPQSVIDYIQRVYDESSSGEDKGEFARGLEFMVLQLRLPIRIRH